MTKPISAHAQTLKILRENQMKAKKHFGQNFIIDPSVVEKIARSADIQDQTVIEVGPGLGALTEQLAKLAKAVIAYEIDPDCVNVLTPAFEGSNVTILNRDFLSVSADEVKASGATRLVGNLPYYITTPILFHVLENLGSVEVITIMVQKEVAERFNAKVGTKDYNALTLILETLCEIKSVMKVNRAVFMPSPAVDSAVVQLRRRPGLSYQELKPFFDFIKQGFTQRRKTLTNNLKDVPDLLKHLEALNLPLTVRAEALTLDQWRKLYEISRAR